MDKSQAPFPIPELDTDKAFKMMAGFDERNLITLKDDYLHLPGNRIVPPLLRMEGRSVIIDDPIKRRPYRAGVMLGSYIGRQRLRAIGVEPTDVFSRDVVGNIDWRVMSTSRFALRQYFAEGIDVKHHMYRTIEQPWADQNNSFVSPEAKHHELTVDWMSIGLGDTCRLIDVAFAEHSGQIAPEPVVAPISA